MKRAKKRIKGGVACVSRVLVVLVVVDFDVAHLVPVTRISSF